jgi:hypothetical protein
VRVGEDIWWPVGRFRTFITSAELPHVLEMADKVTVIRSAWYWLDDSLGPWGRWCKSLQGYPDTEVPRVVKRVAKGWGRSVPGRFALRTSTLIGERDATHVGWALETGHDLDTGDALEIITYGGVERTYRKDQDGDDVSPIVLAFVEGYVRSAMAQIIAARPPENMLQVNTDGWWEIKGARGTPAPEAATSEPWQVVRKATARSVVVHGPNHIETPTDRRLAGVPKDAAQNLDGSFSWHDWPGLRWQLQFSRPGEYKRPGREMMLQDHYCRRWVLDNGDTVPVTTAVSRAGVTALLPWSVTAGRRVSDRLAKHQVGALVPLADDAPLQPLPRLAPPSPPLGRSG